MCQQVFPPSLSHRPFYDPMKSPGSFSSPAPAFVLLACNLLPPWPLLHFFFLDDLQNFQMLLFQDKKKKNKTVLTLQTKIILPCFDALTYLLFLPTITLNKHFRMIISYSPSSLEDRDYSVLNTQLHPQQLGTCLAQCQFPVNRSGE